MNLVSRSELQTILGAMTDVIMVFNVEGRYLKIAPTDPSYLYKPPTELVGKTLYEVYQKKEADFFLEHIRRALDEHKNHRIEYCLKIDGAEVWFDGSVSPISDNSVLWIARDISERKQLEEQLRQAQKMEAVGRLAGGIAHDFNNLLTAINGYSELAMRKLEEVDPLRLNLEEIRKAGDRAAALTRQLLAFSRKQILHPKVINLNAVVADMERMLKRLIGEDIDMRVILKPELGNVKADIGQIEQVIMNLVVNARDAMPRGGKLTIETANIYLGEEYAKHHISVEPGSYVMLAISDNGCGMDKETKARIFEPFFTTKEHGKGTGLGLSTVYGIVKQSKGDIWIYSETGRGTSFKIYLPYVEEEAEIVRPRRDGRPMPKGNETILLVEDDELVRNVAREVLELNGYKVLEAASGMEAEMICRNYEETIHLMLTDIVMPETSGRVAAEQVKELHPETSVLFMSGYTEDAIHHYYVPNGELNFIEKPFTPNDLAWKVREILDARLAV